MDDLEVDSVLDCRGLTCPEPILRSRKAMNELETGQVLKMTSSDPTTLKDIDSWAKRTGNTVLHIDRGDEENTFYIRRG